MKTKAKKPAKKSPDPWNRLLVRIADYGDARVAESWKGGGDPEAVPVVEAQLALAITKLRESVAVLRRMYE